MDSLTGASPRQLARIAGALYLINIFCGAFAIGFVPATLFASDPATTAANIQAHELLYRSGLAAHVIVTVTAMLTLAVGALRSTSASPRWLGWVSVAFAVGSVALIARTNGDHLGMWQRLWLTNNLAWLLLVAWIATARERVER